MHVKPTQAEYAIETHTIRNMIQAFITKQASLLANPTPDIANLDLQEQAVQTLRPRLIEQIRKLSQDESLVNARTATDSTLQTRNSAWKELYEFMAESNGLLMQAQGIRFAELQTNYFNSEKALQQSIEAELEQTREILGMPKISRADKEASAVLQRVSKEEEYQKLGDISKGQK